MVGTDVDLNGRPSGPLFMRISMRRADAGRPVTMTPGLTTSEPLSPEAHWFVESTVKAGSPLLNG